MHKGEQGPSGVTAWASSRAGIVAALTAVSLVVLAFVATSGTPVLHRPTDDRDFPTYSWTEPSETTTTNSANATVPPTGHEATAFGTIVGLILSAGLVAVAVFALYVLFQAIRRGLQMRSGRRKTTAALDVLDIADVMHQDEHAQQQALLEGAPSNAIIACWVRLEQSVSEAGVARRASETTAELALRVLDELPTDGDAVQELAQLYREARFSKHALTEEHRERAQAALTAIHAGLASAPRDQGEQR